MVNLWEREMAFNRVLDAMMMRGIKVDVPFCRRKLAEGDAAMHKILRDLDGRNPASPTDLNTMIHGELGIPVRFRSEKTNKPSFHKKALAYYEPMMERMESPLAKQITAYRGWQKTCSSNYAPYVNLLSPDGRLRCSYNIAGTKTSRLSCSDPNLQNIPKFQDGDKGHAWNWDVKKAFVPKDEEFSLLEVDYSQLEFRLAAAYSQEPTLIEVFDDPDRDVFDEMSEALGHPRQYIKVKVYAGNYGAGPQKIADILGITLIESQKLHHDYIEQYPRLFKLSEAVNEKAKRNKFITYWTGRRRHFPNFYESRKAFNSLLQGGGAEIVKSAMIRLFNEIDGPDCRMLLQVHDSVIFEVRTTRLEEFKTHIMQLMSNVTADKAYFNAPQILERVAFPVEAKLWGM